MKHTNVKSKNRIGNKRVKRDFDYNVCDADLDALKVLISLIKAIY
jgi:hypothetical protein